MSERSQNGHFWSQSGHMTVSLASQISLLQGEAQREAKGSPAQLGLVGGPCWRPLPYLTWLELNMVIPATNTTSPATAAMPSR